MDSSIIEHIKTFDTFYALKTDLTSLESNFYRSGDDSLVAQLLDRYPFLSRESISFQQISQTREELSKLVEAAAIIEVTLAYLSDDIVNSVYETIKSLIKKTFLLDITHDKKIIGGAIFSIDGKQFDYSLISKVPNKQ